MRRSPRMRGAAASRRSRRCAGFMATCCCLPQDTKKREGGRRAACFLSVTDLFVIFAGGRPFREHARPRVRSPPEGEPRTAATAPRAVNPKNHDATQTAENHPSSDARSDLGRSTTPEGVFLTFDDDGPTPGVTEWILATLDEVRCQSHFFVLGKNVEMYPRPLPPHRRCRTPRGEPHLLPPERAGA